MSRTALFYFSGTGNTQFVAERMADALERRGQAVSLFRLEDILKERCFVDYEAFSLIGIGHPVLGFGATGLVERFTEQLPAASGKPAFVFKTASSPHYINHGASNLIMETLRRKGYEPFHNFILAMPCNFYMKYDERLNKQLVEAAVHKVERLAEEISTRTPRTLQISPLLEKLLRAVTYLEEEKGGKMFAQGLRTASSCNRCMKCVRDCPTSNITGGQEGIRFGQSCIWCMRCIYSCPRRAIQATRLRSCVVEPYTGGHHIDQLLSDSQNKGDFITDRSKGYYKHFIAYLKEDGALERKG